MICRGFSTNVEVRGQLASIAYCVLRIGHRVTRLSGSDYQNIRLSGQSFLVDSRGVGIFDIWLLFAGGEKSSASIIRRSCTFDAKKVLDS